MRAQTLSILSLLFIACLVAGCSGGSGGGKSESLDLRGKKVTYSGPPPDWKRTEHKTDPTVDNTFVKPTLFAVEYTPPAGTGHLTVTNLGPSDLQRKGKELREISALVKKEGPNDEALKRVVAELDESGLAGLIEYYDEESKSIKSLENPLHDKLSQAATALQKKQKEAAIKHLDEAAEDCEREFAKKTEVDLIETGRVFWAIKKRDGKIEAKDEIQVDGQRAAWIEFSVPGERGISVLFMKDKNLFSLALNVPEAEYGAGQKIMKSMVETFKVQ